MPFFMLARHTCALLERPACFSNVSLRSSTGLLFFTFISVCLRDLKTASTLISFTHSFHVREKTAFLLSKSSDLLGLGGALCTTFAGYPFCLKTLSRCLSSSMEILLALFFRNVMVPLKTLWWWWEEKCMYLSVCVGFLYTAFDPSFFTSVSRKENSPSD